MKEPHDKAFEKAGIKADPPPVEAGGSLLPFFPAGRVDPLAGWGQPRRRYGWLIAGCAALFVAAGGFVSVRFLGQADAEAATPETPRPVGYRVHHDSDSPDPRVVIEVAAEAPPRGETPPAVVGFLESLPPVKDPAEVRQREIWDAARELQLQAIMAGTNPTASINGQAVRKDSLINLPAGARHGAISFQVVSITDSTVTLVAEDVEIELRLK